MVDIPRLDVCRTGRRRFGEHAMHMQVSAAVTIVQDFGMCTETRQQELQGDPERKEESQPTPHGEKR
jgi:hypothetical protein